MILLLLTSVALSVPESQTMTLVAKKSVYVNSRAISLNIYYQNGANRDNLDKDYLVDKFVDYSVMYKNLYGVDDYGCTSPNLNVYYVSSDYLNDPFYLSRWLKEDYEEDIKQKYVGLHVKGLFESNIFISDSYFEKLSLDKRYIHEISHYWFADSCKVAKGQKQVDESRAIQIESYVE